MNRTERQLARRDMYQEGRVNAGELRRLDAEDRRDDWRREQVGKLVGFLRGTPNQAHGLALINRHLASPPERGVFQMKADLLGEGIITEAQAAQVATRIPPDPRQQALNREAAEEAKVMKTAYDQMMAAIPRGRQREALGVVSRLHGGTNEGSLNSIARELVTRGLLGREWYLGGAVAKMIKRLRGGKEGKMQKRPYANKMLGASPENKAWM